MSRSWGSHDRAGGFELFDGRRHIRGVEILENLRRAGRPAIRRAEVVFQGHRHASQRTGDLLVIDRPRTLQRAIGVHLIEGLELRLGRLDGRQIGLCRLDGRDSARGDRVAQFDGR